MRIVMISPRVNRLARRRFRSPLVRNWRCQAGRNNRQKSSTSQYRFSKVISYKDFTISSGLIRISHLGKSGFLSNFFSIARIAFLVSEIPFS